MMKNTFLTCKHYVALQLVIITSCPFAMVSFREPEPKRFLWTVEGGNWILTIALSFFQNKETPFSQQLLVPLMLYLHHHRGGSSLDLLHFIVVFTGFLTLHSFSDTATGIDPQCQLK